MKFLFSSPSIGGRLASLAMLVALFTTQSAFAQNQTSRDDNSFSGVVTSSTRNTLVVRSSDGRYQLFVFDRDTMKPVPLTTGSQVVVTSSETDEPGVRTARNITVTQAAAARAPGTTGAAGAEDVVPAQVRTIERDIERQARRFQAGVRAGVALDPELVLIGVQAQTGPFFNDNIFLRPNVEFAFGEVTALFALNLEAIYRLPITSRQSRVSTYFGVGPGFNFLHQNFENTTGGKRIDFGAFHSDTSLNLLGGVRYRNGTFMELKTSVYASTAPVLRLIIGYNF